MAETITFQKFWDAYALKRDRVAAERTWKKLSEADRRAAFDGIASYRDDCQRRGIHRMYAQGYLNHRRWEDETEPAVCTVLPSQSKQDSDSTPPLRMEEW